VRAEVLHRTGNLCALWREGRRCPYPATELHHRKPRSAGGSHEVENLLPLCASHHGEVHGNPESSYAEGYLLHSWQPVSPWPDRWFR
jgi:5-methylcytosine-specific restriction endonuclease McrA